MPNLAKIAADVDEYLGKYASEEIINHRFAFWHDVGVTGLGALATVLLGVAEIMPDQSKPIRAFVLFVTGSVTVFSACDQFFKFKAKAQAYRGAAARLLILKRRLQRQDEGEPACAVTDGFSDELDATIFSVDPVWPEATVWKSRSRRAWGVALLALIVCSLIAFTFYSLVSLGHT